MEIQRPTYLNQLIENIGNRYIKIVTGLRRAGKSYLLHPLFSRYLMQERGVAQDHIIMIDLDDFGNKPLRQPDIIYRYVKEHIKDSSPYFLIIDEVQMLDDFVDVLNGFLHISNIDIYITGSNAKFLSSDIATEFRGRGTHIYIHPLSFAEYMSVYDGDKHNAWQEYVLYGGLPAIALKKNPAIKQKMLKELVEETYLNDIITRNNLHSDTLLESVFLLLSSNIGSLTNPHRIAHTFNSEKKSHLSEITIEKYIGYFIDAYLLEKAVKYDIKGNKYIDTPFKYYFSDMGLRNAILNYRQIEPARSMENILYNHLRIQGWHIDVGNVAVFGKNTEGKTIRSTLEVDFVCNKGGERIYIQSAWSLPDEDKLEQEQRSLLAVKDSFRKIIVTADNTPTHHLSNGIFIMNIYDFLLGNA